MEGKEEAPLGNRCEVKNLNSIRALVNAIEYEARRQIDLLENGQQVSVETRWFDPLTKQTTLGRKKEEKLDYRYLFVMVVFTVRYFPEPDLPPLYVPQTKINQIEGSLPLLPHQIEANLCKTYLLTPRVVHILSFQDGNNIFNTKNPTNLLYRRNRILS